MPKIELTKSQCKNLADFIEWHFFQAIREDTEIDCIEWARELLDAEKALREAANDENTWLEPCENLRHVP